MLAHVLHNATAPSRLTQLEFRTAVAKGLLQGYEVARQRNRRDDCGHPLQLTERAFPEPIPDGKRADCLVCSQREGGETPDEDEVQGVQSSSMHAPML